MQKNTTKRIIRCAMIASIYAALCLVLQPLSYGAVQVRISEALTLLPIFTPDAIIGVTLGCFISNMLSFSPIDMIFGTLATLIAAFCTYKMRNIRLKGLPIAGCIPPILINAVVIGFEITYFFMPESSSLAVLIYNMATVALGQFVSCFILGLPLVKMIESLPLLKKFFTDN